MRERRNLTFLLFAAFLTIAIVCFWVFLREHIDFGSKFAVVKEGVLLRSRVPTIPRLQKMKRRYQFKTIVVLLNNEEIKRPEVGSEQNFAKQHSINFIHLPIDHRGPSPEQVTKFLEVVNNPTSQPVLVHCWHGTVRTGVLVAIYRIKEQGWPFQEALDEMASYGFDMKSQQYKAMVDITRGYASKTESEVAPPTN